MVNPFDLKTAILAKHAQHVVLIHFPIALFTAAVAFDFGAQSTKRRSLEDAAYLNLQVAAISTLPVLVTGVLAWPEDQLRSVLCINDVNYISHQHSLAIVDSTLA
jgi:uncharacterized membrane protein